MTPHPPKHDQEPRRTRPRHCWAFEQLEDRRLLATVLGAVIADAIPLTVSGAKIADTIPLTARSGKHAGTIAPAAHINDVIPLTAHSATHAGTVAPAAQVFFQNINGGNVSAVEINLRGGEVDALLVANSGDGHLALFSGGEFPVTAGEINVRGGETDALLVANSDGHLALDLGGRDGLELACIFEEPDLPNPKALAMDELGRIFGVSEGVAAAVPIILGLGGGEVGNVFPGPPGPGELLVAPLQPLSQASLAVVATLLSGAANSGPGATGSAALPNQSPLQTFLPKSSLDTDPDGEADPIWVEISGTAVVTQDGQTPVARFLSGLDEAFSRARIKARQGSLFAQLRTPRRLNRS